MKVVYICIGSACHLKGTHQVIEIFKKLIETYHLEDRLELKAAFCTGHCTEAVAVQKWDGSILSANKENAEAIFISEILPDL
ncbi:MAG: (2Fe-2S) ferredoxin domain-containing protein [Cellulosilyticum sp.]|nr:(2Fe-2S) ferredoxin domain-containing protein [Cellulosilyticum sp.]